MRYPATRVYEEYLIDSYTNIRKTLYEALFENKVVIELEDNVIGLEGESSWVDIFEYDSIEEALNILDLTLGECRYMSDDSDNRTCYEERLEKELYKVFDGIKNIYFYD